MNTLKIIMVNYLENLPCIYSLFKILKHIFHHALQCEEFFYTDLIKPEKNAKRTYRFMSALLNFYFYEISLQSKIQHEWEGLSELKNLQETLRREFLEQKAKCQQKSDNKKKYENEMREMEIKIKKILDLVEQNEEVLQESYKLDQEKDHVLMKKEQILKQEENELQKLTNELHMVQGQIVQSPQQIVHLYEKKVKVKEELENQLKICEQNIKQNHLEGNKLDEKIKEQDALKEDVKEFQSILKEKEKLERENVELNKKHLSLLSKLNDYEICIRQADEEKKEMISNQHSIGVKIKELQNKLQSYITSKTEEEKQLLRKLEEQEILVIKKDIETLKGNIKQCDDEKEEIIKRSDENYQKFCQYLKEIIEFHIGLICRKEY